MCASALKTLRGPSLATVRPSRSTHRRCEHMQDHADGCCVATAGLGLLAVPVVLWLWWRRWSEVAVVGEVAMTVANLPGRLHDTSRHAVAGHV